MNENNIVFNRARASWIENLIMNLSIHSVNAYRKGVRLFSEFLVAYGKVLQSARAKDFEQWRDHMKERGYSQSSINLWMTGIRSFYKFLEDNGLVARSPMANVKGIKNERGWNSRHKTEYLTDVEVQAILETCEDRTEKAIREKAIIGLMLFNGLRTIEVNRLDIDDYKTKQCNDVLFIQRKGQHKKTQITLAPNAKKYLDEWDAVRGIKEGPMFISISRQNRGSRLTTKSIRWIIKERFKLAGISDLRKTTHSLRHTFITNGLNNGTTIPEMMKLTGLKSPNSVHHYYHPDD